MYGSELKMGFFKGYQGYKIYRSLDLKQYLKLNIREDSSIIFEFSHNISGLIFLLQEKISGHFERQIIIIYM
ncbi:hypothetical protein pb186bvf_000306 [Paramecium bursaria]